MKHIKLAVASVLLFAAYAQFPADAEAINGIGSGNSMQQMRSVVEQPEVWGVGKRQGPAPHNPFPFGGGVIDD